MHTPPMITRILFVSALALSSVLSAAETSSEDLLRQGLFEEEANHDFDKAAERYRAVVAAHDRQRALAATATFRLGEIARKKNDKDAAALAFRTVAERFPEQEDLARLSKENLTALGMPVPYAPAAGTVTEAPSKDSEEVEIGRLKNLSRSSPDLIDGATDIGWRPLHLAASNGQIKVMAYLLENHADLDSRTTQEQLTPLQLAAINGHLVAVNALLAAKAKIDEEVDLKSDFDKRLPPKDERVGKIFGSWTALDLAVLYDRREVARALIKAGADIKRASHGFGGMDFTALLEAIYLGRNEIATALIESGAPLGVTESWNSNSPLVLAIRFNSELAPVLLKAGADPNLSCGQAQDTPLLCAVDHRQFDLAKLLIGSGADVKAVNKYGQTALHYACTAELVDLLISKGAEPNVQNKDGATPLDAMAAQREASVAAAFTKLLESGGVVADGKALLAHTSSEMLPIVRERIIYPKEYRADAVLLSVENQMRPSDGANWIDSIEVCPAAGSPTPSIAEALGLFFRNGTDRSAISNLKVVRRNAEGHFVAVFEWVPKPNSPIRTDLPALEWGDILQITLVDGISNPLPNPNRFLESLADRTVTIMLNGVSCQRKLTSPNECWLGNMSVIKYPGNFIQPRPVVRQILGGTLSIINPLGQVPSFADSSRISVTRKGVDRSILVNLSAEGVRPFRLLDGDVIELVVLDSVRGNMQENDQQLILSADFQYGGVVHKKGLFATLSQFAESGNIAPRIDFRSVKVLRDGEVGKEELLDLVKLFSDNGKGNEDVVKVNTLRAGDWILVPSLPEDASQQVRETSANLSVRIQQIANDLSIPRPSAPSPASEPGR